MLNFTMFVLLVLGFALALARVIHLTREVSRLQREAQQTLALEYAREGARSVAMEIIHHIATEESYQPYLTPGLVDVLRRDYAELRDMDQEEFFPDS